jgi:hypothetical protein
MKIILKGKNNLHYLLKKVIGCIMRKNFNTPILLDTSAFISLSSDELEQYNLRKLKIMISPYTFWELLCHLDEDWFRNKGQICKCSNVKILDDPQAIIDTNFEYRIVRLINRLPDNELIPEILECLNKSNSINDFYSSNFIDSRGNKRLISDCSERVRKILDGEAEKYFNFIEKIRIRLVQEKYNMDSDEECHRIIMSLTKVDKIYKKNNSKQTKDLSHQIINKYYLYFAYIFERIKKLLQDSGAQPQRNDYEDSKICLHLYINKPLKFITMDERFSKSLINSIERLKRIGFNSTQHPQIFYAQNKLNLLEIIK